MACDEGGHVTILDPHLSLDFAAYGDVPVTRVFWSYFIFEYPRKARWHFERKQGDHPDS